MKREIKFRALFKNTKQETFWQYSEPNHKVENINNCIQISLWLQYTGLKDKNGREIYEGDIIKFHYFTEELGEGLGVVEGEKEIIGHIKIKDFGVWLESDNKDNGGYLIFFNGIHEESFEIIGNIHENLELL